MYTYTKRLLLKHKQFVKFILSGGVAAIVNLSALVALTEFAGVWYLASSVVAYVLSFFVNFFLQKQWAFLDNERERLGYKMSMFFANSAFNIVLNTSMMYTFVDIFGLWYLLSQILVLGILAIMNYTVYRFIIFRPS